MNTNFKNLLSDNLAWKQPSLKQEQDSASRCIEQVIIDLTSKPSLLAPLGIAFLLLISFAIENTITKARINILEPTHVDYTDTAALLENKNIEITRIRNATKQLEPIMNKSIYPYAFAKSMQALVPASVQLISYELSSKNIVLQVKSTKVEALNNFAAFMESHPMVESNSITIKAIQSSKPPPEMTNVGGSYNNILEPKIFISDISASMRKYQSKDLIALLMSAGDYGSAIKTKDISDILTP